MAGNKSINPANTAADMAAVTDQLMKIEETITTAVHNQKTLNVELIQVHERQTATDVEINAIHHIMNDFSEVNEKLVNDKTVALAKVKVLREILDETGFISQDVGISLKEAMSAEPKQPDNVEAIVAPYLEILTANFNEVMARRVSSQQPNEAVVTEVFKPKPIPVLKTMSLSKPRTNSTWQEEETIPQAEGGDRGSKKKRTRQKSKSGMSESERNEAVERKSDLTEKTASENQESANSVIEQPHKSNPKYSEVAGKNCEATTDQFRSVRRESPQEMDKQKKGPYHGKKKVLVVHDAFMNTFDPHLFSNWFEVSTMQHMSIDEIQRRGSIVNKIKQLQPEVAVFHLGYGDISKDIASDEIVSSYKKLIWDIVEKTDTKICISLMLPVPGLTKHNAKVKEINAQVQGFISSQIKRSDLRNRLFTSNNARLEAHMGTEMSPTYSRLIPALSDRGHKIMWLILRDSINRSLGLPIKPREITNNNSRTPGKND